MLLHTAVKSYLQIRTRALATARLRRRRRQGGGDGRHGVWDGRGLLPRGGCAVAGGDDAGTCTCDLRFRPFTFTRIQSTSLRLRRALSEVHPPAPLPSILLLPFPPTTNSHYRKEQMLLCNVTHAPTHASSVPQLPIHQNVRSVRVQRRERRPMIHPRSLYLTKSLNCTQPDLDPNRPSPPKSQIPSAKFLIRAAAPHFSTRRAAFCSLPRDAPGPR